jgi:CHAT domain-containing protein/Tfp pilus assembly protein PilF
MQGQYAVARRELEAARDLFEKDLNWAGCVRARTGVGAVASRQGDYKSALEHLNSALAMAQAKLPAGHLELARTYYEIGTVYVSTGRPREGLELLAKALAVRRAAGDTRTSEVSQILVRMAVTHTDQGDDDQALALLNEAEAIESALPGHPRLADALMAKGTALWGQGRYDQAIEALEQSVRLLEPAGSPRAATLLAAAYTNLGIVYWSKSDYDEAITFYEKALPLLVAALGEAHPHVGTVEFNLAVLYSAKEDYAASIASAEKALRTLVRALGERDAQVAQTYNVMGVAFTQMGDPDRALGVLQKALAIQRASSEKGDRNSALIYSSLGSAYRAKRAFTRADRHYRKALAVDVSIHGERHPDVAEDFVNLGNLYLEMGDEERAARFFGQAIQANDPRRTGVNLDLDPPIDTAFSGEFLLKALKGAAQARARLGSRKKDHRQLEAAALVYDHTARLIDRMRAGYRAEGSKLHLAASATETYEEAIRTELELHRLSGDARHVEAAFRYSEKSRAGVLRDALNEAEARSFAGIPDALLQQERNLRIDLSAADSRLAEARLEGDADEAQVGTLREKQFALKQQYEALRQRFEKEYPDYHDLKYRSETVGPSELRDALDERTVLVEYFLGEERVFIFTVTREGLEVTATPRDASLAVELSGLRQAILTRDVASHARCAHRLYERLLAPIEGRLAGKDLIVVPDGALAAVPFEALLSRETRPDTDTRKLPYVLRDHALSYAYSATLLVQGLRHDRGNPPDEFVAFAPVFAGAGAAADAPGPLPASQKEVTEIRGLFTRRAGVFGGWLSGRSRVYLGEDATESRLESAGLERYRYVHLATHAIVDEEHPALSRLLLAPEAGSGKDGVLRLAEIYNLRLNADLVVLSACDTGRGQIARGEGIIGLTRGFLYAGASSLLVSFWPVSDAASAGLVVDFYRELLSGRPKAEALRQAKLHTMGRNPEYAKPYYWASLVLVGQRR